MEFNMNEFMRIVVCQTADGLCVSAVTTYCKVCLADKLIRAIRHMQQIAYKVDVDLCSPAMSHVEQGTTSCRHSNPQKRAHHMRLIKIQILAVTPSGPLAGAHGQAVGSACSCQDVNLTQ